MNPREDLIGLQGVAPGLGGEVTCDRSRTSSLCISRETILAKEFEPTCGGVVRDRCVDTNASLTPATTLFFRAV